MADVAGITFAIFATFNVIVEDIHLLQLGHHFGRDYNTCLVKLANTKCRLTRWAHSVDLRNDITDQEQLTTVSTDKLQPYEDLQVAKLNLDQIMYLLAQARTTTTKYGDPIELQKRENILHGLKKVSNKMTHLKTSAKVTEPPSAETVNVVDPKVVELCEHLGDLSVSRQKDQSFLKKAKWVMLDKDVFEQLIVDVASLTRELEELFPATKTNTSAMAAAEAEIMKGFEDVGGMLSKFFAQAKARDSMLEAALGKLSQQKQGENADKTGNTYNSSLNGGNWGLVSNAPATYNAPMTFGGSQASGGRRRDGSDAEEDD